MHYEQMVESLQRHLDQHDAESAGTVLAATVQALSENAWREAADFRSQLPEPLRSVEPAGPGDRASVEEFSARIGELCGAPDTAQARAYAEAAFRVLSESITAGQLRQLLADLPEDYAILAPPIAGLTADAETLLAQVRHQAGLDTIDHAREATEAVLTTTAEAVSGGQATRLADNLPTEIGALLRGSEPTQHTDTDRFLNEVTRRSPTTTTPELVRTHTNAVFTVLREWAPGELADTLNQLPRPLAALAT